MFWEPLGQDGPRRDQRGIEWTLRNGGAEYMYHHHIGWLVAIVWVLAIAGFGWWQKTWQTPAHLFTVAAHHRMTVAEAQTGAGPEAANVYEDLLTKAKTQGSVHVVVRLQLDDWQPESALRDQHAIDAQGQTIVRLQDRLLHDMAAFVVTNIRRFRFVPQIALTVDETGLRALLSHPDVSTIWEDRTLAPRQ
jgi:hypothetical protein